MKSQAELKKMYTDLKTENIKLKQTIEMQGQTIEMQGQTIEELKRSVTDLKRRLVRHDNYNTPPSQKRGPGWPDTKGKGDEKNADNKSTKASRDQKDRVDAAGSGKSRGGQKGHKGRTRKPKPTEFEEHTPEACPECGSGSLSIVQSEKRDITRVERTIKVITTRHTINTCRCSCGLVDIKPETGLPDKGSYDPSITTDVADDYVCRMPFRMIADRMSRYGITLSSGTAHNIMRRLGTSLGAPAAAIVAMIRKAKILHADETSIHLNGRNVWVWILHDPLTGHALYVIRDSRGAKVLKEALGGWDGTLVCDGWTAYGKYRVQRCWSHIIREARDICNRNPDCPGARNVLKHLRIIYDYARRASRKRSRSLRDNASAMLTSCIEKIVARYADDPILEKFMVKISNAGSDLFRFVLNPKIPPTNNAAERGLREIVVHRKIRGSIRAEETMTWMANFFSCVMTWKNKKLDYLAEIAKYA